MSDLIGSNIVGFLTIRLVLLLHLKHEKRQHANSHINRSKNPLTDIPVNTVIMTAYLQCKCFFFIASFSID